MGNATSSPSTKLVLGTSHTGDLFTSTVHWWKLRNPSKRSDALTGPSDCDAARRTPACEIIPDGALGSSRESPLTRSRPKCATAQPLNQSTFTHGANVASWTALRNPLPSAERSVVGQLAATPSSSDKASNATAPKTRPSRVAPGPRPLATDVPTPRRSDRGPQSPASAAPGGSVSTTSPRTDAPSGWRGGT